ncbi:MAG: PP2C family protein-serine/threonine phosphatase [Marmoricola sp.]
MASTETRPGTNVPTMRVPAPPERTGGGTRPPAEPERSALNASHRHRARNPRRAAALIATVCLLLTAASTWAAARVDQGAEDRLLQVQTKQVAAVLSTAILVIQQPLSTALDVQRVSGSTGEGPAFKQLMARYIGDDQFVSASLWRRTHGRLAPVASVGVAPALPRGGAAARSLVSSAFSRKTFVVRAVDIGDRQRLAFVMADRASGYVVYAERSISANRRSRVDSDSAFSDLHYALYLGPKRTLKSLSTTDVALSSLPLSGRTASTTVPFGDTVLTVVTSPRRHLGASLGQRLPLILLIGGLLLTLIAVRSGYQLIRRRQDAENDTATITDLYERVDALFGEQRDLFVRLQRALLPQVNPDIPELEIASQYVAGTQGVDIGGDWYSIIGLGEDHFAFVVGDVSGRGVDSVAVMAHARFTLRAYLIDGDSPALALEKCSRQFDISVDGHITTALVGVGNARTGEITLASAGHPTPLLITAGAREFVQVPAGLPLGAGAATYRSTRFTMTPGATLFGFTDGLVERRGEDIDVGMQRLADTMTPVSASPVEEMVSHALRKLRPPTASDDIAVLAIRWDPKR